MMIHRCRESGGKTTPPPTTTTTTTLTQGLVVKQ
jgi:hypothetical protein